MHLDLIKHRVDGHLIFLALGPDAIIVLAVVLVLLLVAYEVFFVLASINLPETITVRLTHIFVHLTAAVSVATLEVDIPFALHIIVAIVSGLV